MHAQFIQRRVFLPNRVFIEKSIVIVDAALQIGRHDGDI